MYRYLYFVRFTKIYLDTMDALLKLYKNQKMLKLKNG